MRTPGLLLRWCERFEDRRMVVGGRWSFAALVAGSLLAASAIGCGHETVVTAEDHTGPRAASHEPRAGSHAHGEEGHAGVDAGHTEEAHEHSPMPESVVPPKELHVPKSGPDAPASRERDLYFTPCGCYTEADILANGPVLPSRKFRGIHANHNVRTRRGDRICPVTGTRANAKFQWRIGGKTYRFCCPSCIDDFVRRAKREPKSIQAPEAYVKR